MANRIKFTVPGSASTAATAQISLGTFALATIPGFGDVTALTRWGAIMETRLTVLHNGGDHGAQMWTLTSACKQQPGSGFSILTPPVADNASSGGALFTAGLGVPAGTFVWDNSANVVRFRVTPGGTEAMYWIASHDVEIWIP